MLLDELVENQWEMDDGSVRFVAFIDESYGNGLKIFIFFGKIKLNNLLINTNSINTTGVKFMPNFTSGPQFVASKLQFDSISVVLGACALHCMTIISGM